MTRRLPSGPKVAVGNKKAPGYWAGSPYKTLAMFGVGQGIRVDQQDKLIMAGRRAYLYLPVQANTPAHLLQNAAEPCFCTWRSNESSDVECLQCYGTKFSPGYVRFGWSTLHCTVNEVAPERSGGPAAWTFIDTSVDTTNRPYRIKLDEGEVTGTFTTTDYAYSNPTTITPFPTENGPIDWEVNVDSSLRVAASSALIVEFSTDAGGTWDVIADLNDVGVRPEGTGTIRFRVTMTRTTAAVPSPQFDAIRMRRRRIEGINPQIMRGRRVLEPLQIVGDGYAAGEILVLRGVEDIQMMLDRVAGKRTEAMGDAGWTSPLDFFDTALTANTSDARIREDDAGPHAFYQRTSGIFADERFAMTQIKYSEEIGGAGGGYFTSQSWTDRKLQAGESGLLVW